MIYVNQVDARDQARETIANNPDLANGNKATRRTRTRALAVALTVSDSGHRALLAEACATHTPARNPAHRAIHDLIAAGIPPTAAAVNIELADIAAPPPTDDDGRRIAATVNAHHQAHREGPTWGEIGRNEGWPSRAATGRRIETLIAMGWLTATRRVRSLSTGERFTDAEPGRGYGGAGAQ